MRILKATQTYLPYLSKGGQPATVSGIARALAQRGHQVTVLTADYGEPDYVSTKDAKREEKAWGWESSRDGVEAIYLRSLTNYRATTINPDLINFCAGRLRDYDVVHIYGLYDLIGAVVAWFCRRRCIPYLLEPLGMFGPKIRSQHKKRLYARVVGSTLFQGAKSVIATSETERLELVEGGIAEERIVLRRNGLDLSEFQTLPARGALRQKLDCNEKERLILFLGRLSFIKGLDLLVEAFSQVNIEARLVIAGPNNEDGCLESVRGLIAGLQLDHRVNVLGALYGGEKLEAMVDADLFVLPSRYESFGNAAAESIACGTPVLVTDKCGIAPLIDGRAGLVTPRDIEGIAAGINLLLDNKTLLARFRKGCEGVSRNLSWDGPVEAMESLYASLIKCHEIQPVKEITHLQSSY